MTADHPPGTLESLLAEREWVRALARSLVADPGLADDVEQQTWLAATEHPPDDVSSPRAWLGTVVRNFVRRAGRAAGRRRLREAAAARPEAMPSAADMVAHAEAHRRVVGAVLALDEPYRSAVLARFFEDMPPREIAARMGVPVETVRTRLKRGLASLRVRLDAEYGGDGKAWGLALLPLAAMKGGLIVKGTTKAAIAVAALLVVAGTVAVVWTAGGDGGGSRSGAELAAVAPSPATGTAGHAAATAPAAGPASVVAAATAEVRGEVWFASPPKPAPGIDVVVGGGTSPVRTVRTDDAGRFVAAGLPEGFRGRVVVRAEKFATVARPLMPLRAGERRDAGLFTLAAAASVRFVVADFDGRPVEGAAIEGRRTEMGGWHDPTASESAWRDVREPECSATTDAAGRAALDDVEPSEWTFVARKSGFADASVRDVRLRAGTAPVTVKLHLFPGLKLAGRVLDRDRKGVVGVIVWAEARFAANRYSDAVTPHAVTAADGAYAFDDLVEGVYAIRVSRPGSPLVGAGNVRLPASAPFDIVLAGRRLVGTVREADGGAPLAGAIVRAESNGTIEATTGADGTYVLDTVVETWAIYNLRVAKAGWYQAQDAAPKSRNPQFGDPPTVLGDATPAVRDFNMRRGAKLTGRVLCKGESVRGARVMFQREGAFGLTDTAADADGRYVFEGLAPGTVFLTCWSPGWGFVRAAGSPEFVPGQPYGDRVEVTEKEGAVHDLEMTPTGDAPARPTVRVKGNVTAASGLHAAFVQVAHAYEIGEGRNGMHLWLAIPRHPVGPDGSFDVEVSAYPDVISVRGGADGCAPSTVKATEVSGSPGVFEARVQLLPAGRIAGRAVGEETNAPIAGADVILDVDERHGWSNGDGRPNVEVVVARTDADGRFTIEGVPAGPHQVEVVADGRLPARRAVETSAAETEFRLPPMHSISGVVTYADGRPARMLSIDVTFDEASTSGWKTIGVAQTRSDGSFTIGYIPAGTYKLLVTDGLSQAGIQRVELHSIAADTKDLRITVGDALAIRGRVVDPDGKPVANASVEAWPETGHAHGYGTTRQDGTFEMTGLEPQTYKVRAHAPRAMEFRDYGVMLGGRLLGVAVAGVRPPRDDLSVTLVLGRTIEGVALDEAGAPLKHRYVRADVIAYEDRDALVDDARNAAAETDDDGRFEIAGLPPGTYGLVALTVVPKPEPQPLVGGERVTAGTRGLRVTLGRYATISGVVLGEDDKPLAKAEVRAYTPDGSTSWSAMTDADGAFTLKRLDAGASFDLHASADGRAPAKAAGVASGTASVRLRLTAGLRSTGRLLDAHGDPVKDTSLTFATDASPVKARAKTDADGRFEVSGLLPGTYRAEWFGVKDNRSERWPCGTFEAGAADVELRAE